jgi:hypothetical protein
MLRSLWRLLCRRRDHRMRIARERDHKQQNAEFHQVVRS